jgi:hypothetical protein
MQRYKVTKTIPGQGKERVLATLPSKTAAWKWAVDYALEIYEPGQVEKHPIKNWIGLNELDQGPDHNGFTTVAILVVKPVTFLICDGGDSQGKCYCVGQERGSGSN